MEVDPGILQWLPGLVTYNDTIQGDGQGTLADAQLSAMVMVTGNATVTLPIGSGTSSYSTRMSLSTTGALISKTYPHQVPLRVSDNRAVGGEIKLIPSIITTNDTGYLDFAVSGKLQSNQHSFELKMTGKHPNVDDPAAPVGRVRLGYSADKTREGIVEEIILSPTESALYWNTSTISLSASSADVRGNAPADAKYVVAYVDDVASGITERNVRNNVFPLPLSEIDLTSPHIAATNNNFSFKARILVDLAGDVDVGVYWGDKDQKPLPGREPLWTPANTSFAKRFMAGSKATKRAFTVKVPSEKIVTAPPEAESLLVIADTDAIAGVSPDDLRISLDHERGSLITAAQLAAVSSRAMQYEPLINAMFSQYAFNISTLEQRAHILAQMAAETNGFRKFRESFYFRNRQDLVATHKRVKQLPSSEIKTLLRAKQNSVAEKRIANVSYGTRLGNEKPDDGWRYLGRGALQLTGRDNYQALQSSGLAGGDVLVNPDLLSDPNNQACWDAAGYYWKSLGSGGAIPSSVVDNYAWRPTVPLPDYGETADNAVQAVTRSVNGGQYGLGKRIRVYLRVRAALLNK